MVYYRFHSDSQTIIQFSQEGSEVGLDIEVREGVLEVERVVYKKTNVSSTELK